MVGEIHYSLLEGIIFPHGAISKANIIVGRWVGDLYSDMLNKTVTNVPNTQGLDEKPSPLNSKEKIPKKKKKPVRKIMSTTRNNSKKNQKRQIQLFDTD